MTEITDKSLLRCTIKKSVHTTERLVVYVSYAVVATTIVAIAAFGALNVLPPLLEIASRLITGAWSVLSCIPWYYYAGAAAMVAIPAYSFLWCVSRDLTDDDWESKSANEFALALAVIAPAVIVAIAAIALALATITALSLATITALVALTAIVALATLAAIALSVDPVSEITIWYYIFRFHGAAWHHYTKEI